MLGGVMKMNAIEIFSTIKEVQFIVIALQKKQSACAH